MIDSNPFQPPDAKTETRHKGRPIVLNSVLVLFYFWPLSILISVYGCWIVAWCVLGRHPVPIHDDPKYIGGAMDTAYETSWLVMSLDIYLIPAGLIAAVFRPLSPVRDSIAAMAFSIAGHLSLLAVVFFIFFVDPYRVFDWYFD